MNKLYIMDSNILFCYLEIPRKNTVGSSDWNLEKIKNKIEEIKIRGEGIVIPLPVMIEVGNTIGHNQDLTQLNKLNEIIENTIDKKSPFHSFQEQELFWKGDRIKQIISEWKNHIFTSDVGLGDILILALAWYFKSNISGRRYEVEIWS